MARCLDLIDKSGLPYQLGPLGTCVEGEWDEVMNVIRLCYDKRPKLMHFEKRFAFFDAVP